MLDAVFRQTGTRAYAISTAGCPIAIGLDRAEADKDGCARATRAVMDHIAADRPARVLIVASWFGVLDQKNTIYQGQRSFDAASRLANAQAAIADTGAALRALDVTSGFLVTVPGAHHAVPEALFRATQLGSYPDIRRTAMDYAALMDPIASVAETSFDHVIQTGDLLCASGICDIVRDGKPLYYDSNHPSQHLNDIMISALGPRLTTFVKDPAK
jgi:hypothetical protein